MMRARKSGVKIRGIVKLSTWKPDGISAQLAAVRSETLFVSFDIFHRYGMSAFSDHLM